MYDMYGDGWTGTRLYLGDYIISLYDGLDGNQTVCLPEGSYYPYACGGNLAFEVWWDVYGNTGNVTGGATNDCNASAASTEFIVNGPTPSPTISVQPVPSPTIAPYAGTCFSQMSTVSVLMPGSRFPKSLPLSNLEVGTRVLTADAGSTKKSYVKVVDMYRSFAAKSELEPYLDIRVSQGPTHSTIKSSIKKLFHDNGNSHTTTDRPSTDVLRVTRHHTFPECHGKKFALLCFSSLPVSLLIPALRGLSQKTSPCA
jgi:hypothetical protein